MIVYNGKSDRADLPPSLNFLSEEHPPVKITTTDEIIPIGRREKGNIVVVPDETVSRSHAQIERGEGGWTIRDLGSENDTQVKEVPECPTGEIALPQKEWMRIPPDRTIAIAVGESVAAIEQRAGLYFADIRYKNRRLSADVLLPPETPIHIGGRKDVPRQENKEFNPQTIDLLIPDTTVSKDHVHLLPTRDGLLVRDNESYNGTTVTSHELPAGEKKPVSRNIAYLRRMMPQAYDEESIGGNAGFVSDTEQEKVFSAAGINFYIHTKSGEIAQVSNHWDKGEQQPELVRGGFKVIQQDGEIKITEIYSRFFEDLSKDLSPKAKLTLYNTVARWNKVDEMPDPEK